MNRRLIDAAVALADTLARESAALAAMDLAGAAAMLPAKQAAAASFAAAQALPMPPAMPSQVEALRAVAERLRDAAEENRRLLERALRVQGRVVGIVARAARPKPAAPRYAASGDLAPDRAAPLLVSARA